MKSKKELEKISKLLSLVLRHKPEEIGIELDSNGYTNVQILLGKLSIDISDLNWIVDTNNGKRFTYNSDNTLIRANQGHSINSIDLKLKEVENPPKFLLHGTSYEFLDSIYKDGLLKMKRNHVHLTDDKCNAYRKGLRKGKNVIIIFLDTDKYLKDGNKIFIAENGVYLTDDIKSDYLIILASKNVEKLLPYIL